MKTILIVAAFGAVVLVTEALAQSPSGGALPVEATAFVCHWGTEAGRGEAFEIENGALITQQTGDTWNILKNNQFGFVATQSQSEFVPRLNKKTVAFYSIAIDRTTGKAVRADADTEYSGSVNHGTCSAQP
jgi:hypothetical protein